MNCELSAGDLVRSTRNNTYLGTVVRVHGTMVTVRALVLSANGERYTPAGEEIVPAAWLTLATDLEEACGRCARPAVWSGCSCCVHCGYMRVDVDVLADLRIDYVADPGRCTRTTGQNARR